MAVPTWAPTRQEGMGLRLMLANITALRPRIHEVLAVDADVLALVETRATEAGQRILGATAARAGWVPHWGAPLLPRVSGSPWDTAPGGGGDFRQEGSPSQDSQNTRRRRGAGATTMADGALATRLPGDPEWQGNAGAVSVLWNAGTREGVSSTTGCSDIACSPPRGLAEGSPRRLQ